MPVRFFPISHSSVIRQTVTYKKYVGSVHNRNGRRREAVLKYLVAGVEAGRGHLVRANTAEAVKKKGKRMFGDITEVFGLYELSNEGTVLYSRPRGEDGLRQATTEVLGQDLFRDIFRCQNNEDLRRHFRRFISSDRPVDTFHFDCLYDRRVVRTKIFMTRAHETVDDGAGQIVIMDIRCADH